LADSRAPTLADCLTSFLRSRSLQELPIHFESNYARFARHLATLKYYEISSRPSETTDGLRLNFLK